MKVLLINPPFDVEHSLGESKSIEKVLNIIQPLGLAYLASVLLENKYDVNIIDCAVGISLKGLLSQVRQYEPDIVGITSTTPSFESAKLVAKNIREIFPKTVIVIGGVHITAVPNDILAQKAFDVGVLAEGEETLLELVRHVEECGLKDLDKIKGIVYKDGDQVLITPQRPYIENLDKIPFPARQLLNPLDKYHPTPASYRRLPVGVLMTSRGCPCRCTFCDRAIFGNNTRLRSTENVLDEIEELVHKYGAREIRFFDDTFTIDKKRVYEICEGLHKRNLKLPWTCLTGVNFVTLDLLKTMKKAGCWQVLYGLESGDNEVLKGLRKGNTVKGNEQAIKWSQEAGLNVRGDFIVGTPGQTLDAMYKTLKFALDMGLDYAHFNKFVPFPGTNLYQELVKKGYSFDFSKPSSILDHSALLYVPKSMTKEEYREFLDSSFKKFYLRPSYILKRLLSIRTLDELKGQVSGFLSIQGL